MTTNNITIDINKLNAEELHQLANLLGRSMANEPTNQKKLWDRYYEIDGWKEA